MTKKASHFHLFKKYNGKGDAATLHIHNAAIPVHKPKAQALELLTAHIDKLPGVK